MASFLKNCFLTFHQIIESIIEESQKVLQLEDDSLDSKGKGHSDQATASPLMAGTDLSNIPGLLAIDQALQEDSKRAESQNAFEETELESKKIFFPRTPVRSQ